MSPTILAQEVNDALSSRLDPKEVLMHVRQFLSELPAQSLFGGTAETPVDSEFARWWSSLPSEMKVGKRDAMKAWGQSRKALPPTDDLIWIVQCQTEIRKRTGQAFLHPATFLRGRRWEDSLEALASWGGKRTILDQMPDFERKALDNDARFCVES